ncbi:DUF6452 family protein [Bacteroidota bacterium]
MAPLRYFGMTLRNIKSGSVLRFLIGVWISLPFILGCEDTDCTSSSTSNINVSFYDQDSLYKKFVSFDIVTAIGTDSLFYDQNDILNTFILPAHPAVDSTVFLFQNHDGSIDTLVVFYNRRIRLLSESCGFEQIYSGLEASTTFPDVEVITSILNRLNVEDIKIYI